MAALPRPSGADMVGSARETSREKRGRDSKIGLRTVPACKTQEEAVAARIATRRCLPQRDKARPGSAPACQGYAEQMWSAQYVRLAGENAVAIRNSVQHGTCLPTACILSVDRL
eukprot:6525642-Prymnesium_polylepis.1